jgi:hypothetical protein
LIISPSRLQALRAAIEEAAASTAKDLRRAGSFPFDLCVSRAALCSLSEFPERAVFCGEEMMASVLVSYRGRPLGTSVLSLEPRHALELIRSLEAQGNPLEVFRGAGASVLRGMLGWFAAAGGSPVAFGDPILEERSLVATVLGTHAPSGTMVVSFEVGFASESRTIPAYAYLLLDAKTLRAGLGLLGERGLGA